MSSDEIMRASPALSSRSGQSVAARLIARPVLGLPALWLAALLIYLPTYLHSDVSWYLVATERFVSGARLYQDVIEVNPPLAFYLMAPPVLAAGMTGIPSRALRRLCVPAAGARPVARGPPAAADVKREANFDYLAYFQRDPRFARLWQSYVKIGEISLQVGASPLSDGTRRVFDLWCRKSGTHECPVLGEPG